jgi:hypothetical protein
MELQRGDKVRTEAGEVGEVLHVSRLTVFVMFAPPDRGEPRVEAFLESQLSRADAPYPQRGAEQ